MDTPFQDYSRINRELKKEFLREINRVLNLNRNHDYSAYIEEFEENFAGYCGAKLAIGVDSGTSALQLSMAALGIKEGDEVILPCYTYISTALAISNLGATPVFADVKEDMTLDPDVVGPKITRKTKAIIPVHIHGNPCEIDHISEICKKNKLALIEDASQAHGAKYKGKRVGGFGVGCFSLHTSKTLGGIGDAGIICLNDGLYNNIRQLMLPDNNTREILLSRRTPCVISPLQTAILKVKLSYLDRFNERKNEIAELYNKLIIEKRVSKIVLSKDSYPVYRDYCIKTSHRTELQKFLQDHGIETAARYKVPLHLTETYSYLGYKRGDFPVAEEVADSILSLPSFIGITDKEIRDICDRINEFQ